ncbi:MAG: ABC transporter permease [Thermoplasmata archaeon]
MDLPQPRRSAGESRRGGAAFPAFAIIGWRWISRNPAATVAPILLPFIFLYFLKLISPPEYVPLEIVGAILFTTQNIGSWVLGDSASWRLETRMQDVFIASPLSKLRYLFGIAFSNLVPAVPALLVLGALLALTISVPPLGWVVLVGVILVLWILFSALGLAISSRVRSQREIWPVGNLTFTVIGMLSPLYYPLSILPPWWQTAARFLPTTYAALLVQGELALPGAVPSNLGLDAALLVGLAFLGTMLALRLYQWREGD